MPSINDLNDFNSVLGINRELNYRNLEESRVNTVNRLKEKLLILKEELNRNGFNKENYLIKESLFNRKQQIGENENKVV